MTEQPHRPRRSLPNRIWQRSVRIFVSLAGLIFFLYGLGGLIEGEILPGAGRGNLPTPHHLTGISARLYGLLFVGLGIYLVALASRALARKQPKRRRK